MEALGLKVTLVKHLGRGKWEEQRGRKRGAANEKATMQESGLMSPCVIALATMARAIVIKEREREREKTKGEGRCGESRKGRERKSGGGEGESKIKKKKTAVKNSRTTTKREAAFAVKTAKHFQTTTTKKKHARFGNKKNDRAATSL